MSDDDELNACIEQHIRGDLAGKCALVLIRQVLCTEHDVGSLDCLSNRRDIDCRYAVNDIHIRIVYERFEKFTKFLCLAGSLVHLPVAGNNLSTCHSFPFCNALFDCSGETFQSPR